MSVWKKVFGNGRSNGRPTVSSRSQSVVASGAEPKHVPQRIATIDQSKKKNWVQSFTKGRVEYKAGKLIKYGTVWKISYKRQKLNPSPTETLASMKENYPEVLLLTFDEAKQYKA